jgi:quinohemoprotein ethanol dehydrogenase
MAIIQLHASRIMAFALLAGLSCVQGCGHAGPAHPPTTVQASSEQDGRNWASYGRNYSEQHFSPLGEVKSTNIGELGLAWSMELPGVHSAATVPLEVDGVLYFSVGLSVVHAVDAASGRQLWQYDPEVWKVAGRKLRFSWGARGIAFWNGKVYVGTTDGRLIAIDAKTGTPVWTRLTVSPDDTSGITGAPRAFGGLVVIGQAGGEYASLRSYVTAYDAETGEQRWRFHTVPGDPSKGSEDQAQALAATTWTGRWWEFGGGGSVWNAITYDPELDLVYIGTGNGQPWNQKIRSPGGGDNLFLVSIVALDAKTGRYRWHYQEVPGNSRDYDASTDITLAHLRVAGADRKVILTAAKDGFVYVIDRETGKLVSGDPYSVVTWATGIDPATGRPLVVDGFRLDDKSFLMKPASSGAHTWQPQSFNPGTGLLYTPTMLLAENYNDEGVDRANFHNKLGQVNLGVRDYDADGPASFGKSTLLAWDPVRKSKAWEVPTPGLWNGGTLTTAGNLLFQGLGNGYFNAYRADTGEKVWSFNAKMGITGAPITYTVNGRQYVTVIAGWGGSGAGYMGSMAAQEGWVSRVHTNRVLTFALGGKAALPANLPAPQMVRPLVDPGFRIDEAKVVAGRKLYARTCFMCHGVGAVAGGYAPDLRASPIPLDRAAFSRILRDGALEPLGMPKYAEFTGPDIEGLRHYIRWVAHTYKTPPEPATRP